MVLACRWSRSRLLARYEGCPGGAHDHGGPSAVQAKPYGPRVHRCRTAFASSAAHRQFRAPAITTTTDCEDRRCVVRAPLGGRHLVSKGDVGGVGKDENTVVGQPDVVNVAALPTPKSK